MALIVPDILRFLALALGVLCLAVILATFRIYRSRGIGPYVGWMGAFGVLAVLALSVNIYTHLGEMSLVWWRAPLSILAFACLLWSMWKLRQYHQRRK